MTIESKSEVNSKEAAASLPQLTPAIQRQKASQLLLRLQWLLIAVLMAAVLWLYISQQRFEHMVMTQLHNTEQVTTRLNEMDDRLFAISQQSLPEPSRPLGDLAQNQLDMLRVQLQAADRLLEDSNHEAVIALLRGLVWQLNQDSNKIAPALTIVLKQSLQQDIDRLQAQSVQLTPWQLHNVAIADIQDYLRGQLPSASTPVTAGRLAKNDILIHEAIMTLNLAMQASNMQDQSLLILYLQQTKDQLIPLTVVNDRPQSSMSKSNLGTDQAASMVAAASSSDPDKKAATSFVTEPETPERLVSMQDAISWLDDLISSPPSQTTLITSQVLSGDIAYSDQKSDGRAD